MFGLAAKTFKNIFYLNEQSLVNSLIDKFASEISNECLEFMFGKGVSHNIQGSLQVIHFECPIFDTIISINLEKFDNLKKIILKLFFLKECKPAFYEYTYYIPYSISF